MRFSSRVRAVTLAILFICVASPAFSSTPSSKQSFFDLSAYDTRNKKIHFTHYRGKVVLVVNTASQGGFSAQLKDLEEIQKKYSAKGFTVLAFPSDDFNREKDNNEEIQKKYGVTFPIFSKGPVSGKNQQEIFRFLTSQKKGLIFQDVHWNFEKFLVSRDGRVIERWGSITSPTSKSVLEKIEKALLDPI